MSKPRNSFYVYSRFHYVIQPGYYDVDLIVQSYLPDKFLILISTHYSPEGAKALPRFPLELGVE